MKQETITAINWMEYSQLQAILENYGFAVNEANESWDDLSAAVKSNVIDGTIPESEVLP